VASAQRMKGVNGVPTPAYGSAGPRVNDCQQTEAEDTIWLYDGPGNHFDQWRRGIVRVLPGVGFSRLP
jgi:hypothetical protein